MSTLLRMITPHVGIARLLLVSMVPLVPVDNVGSVVMLENVVLAFGKVVAIQLLDLLVPDTILVALPDGRVGLISVESLISEMSLVHPVCTSILILSNSRWHTYRFQS